MTGRAPGSGGAAPRVSVVGLGPGGPDLLTAGTRDELERVPVRFVRTTRHPAAPVVRDARSFDELYERAESIEDVYRGIVEALVSAASAHGEVLYAVPGSPRVAERSVELLAADDRVETVVHPALSFLDLAWVRLGVDPLAAGVTVVDGHDVAAGAAGRSGPLLVAQCDSKAVLSDLKLAFGDEPPAEAVVLQRLGLEEESIRTVPWADLDRAVDPDHLTSVYVPAPPAPVAAEVVRLLEVGRTLRERCPWDREQTHESLLRYLLEESYEVIEAVQHLAAGDDGAYAHLEEELGDVLFQVVFHCAIAAQAGAFDFGDVARGIADKLVRRHPHVFGDVEVAGAGEVVANWEAIKREEKGRTSALDGVTETLPALLLAAEVAKKASRVGAGPEAAEVPGDPGELGDLLLRLVEGARRAGLDAEAALRAAALRLRDDARAAEPSS